SAACLFCDCEQVFPDHWVGVAELECGFVTRLLPVYPYRRSRLAYIGQLASFGLTGSRASNSASIHQCGPKRPTSGCNCARRFQTYCAGFSATNEPSKAVSRTAPVLTCLFSSAAIRSANAVALRQKSFCSPLLRTQISTSRLL